MSIYRHRNKIRTLLMLKDEHLMQKDEHISTKKQDKDSSGAKDEHMMQKADRLST